MSAAVTRSASRAHLVQAFIRDIRSPEWGLLGQGVRFALSGGLVALTYITVTTVLHDVLALRFQIALAIGFAVSICLHFTLQRVFVWRHHRGFALAAHSQIVRYLGMCTAQYGLTAVATSQLPRRLGLPVEAVYLMAVLVVTGVNFAVFRGRVFHQVVVQSHE